MRAVSRDLPEVEAPAVRDRHGHRSRLPVTRATRPIRCVHHRCGRDARRGIPRQRSKCAIQRLRGSGRPRLFSSTAQRGHHRGESLRRYTLQLLRHDLRMAEGRRVLHQEGRRHLPGRAEQPALLGGLVL